MGQLQASNFQLDRETEEEPGEVPVESDPKRGRSRPGIRAVLPFPRAATGHSAVAHDSRGQRNFRSASRIGWSLMLA